MMKLNLSLVSLIVTGLILTMACGVGQSAPSNTWAFAKDSSGYAAIIGNNYRNFQTAGGHPLYSTVRSPSAPYKTTISLDITRSANKPTTVTKRLGAFSGEERHYDFGTAAIADSFLGTAAATLQVFGNSKGFITLVPGGGVDGGSPENWAAIRANNAKYFKDFIYAMVMAVSSGAYFAQHPIMAFELGNEVNAVGQFNVLGVKNEKDPNYSDAKQARGYVDDFLAPAIEAVRKASSDLYGDPEKLLIISAGIATIYNPNSLKFVDTFMNLTPSSNTSALREPIKNYIDILGIHYVMRFPFNTSKNNNDYAATFEHLKTTWVDTNIVRGIWSTEEGGDHGRGAYDALLSSFRFIHWWSQRGWDKLSLGGKLIWFGENDWYNFKEVQGKLLDLWAGGTERQLDLTKHLALPNAQLEGYALGNSSLTDPKIALVVSSNAPAISGSGKFSEITLNNLPSGMDGKSLRVSAYRVTATVLDETVKPPIPVGKPMTPQAMTLRSDSDGMLRIQMPETSLARDELLFITISR